MIKKVKDENNNYLYLLVIPVIIIAGYFILKYMDNAQFEKEMLEEYNEIEYEFPKIFDEVLNDHYASYYDNEGLSCNVSIYPSKKHKDGKLEEWFKGIVSVSLNDKVGELKGIEIDGKKAYTVDVLTQYENEHHYGVESTNYYYSIEYSTNDKESNDNACTAAEDEFLRSIKLK